MMKDFFDKKLSIKVHLMVFKFLKWKNNNFFSGALITPQIKKPPKIHFFKKI